MAQLKKEKLVLKVGVRSTSGSGPAGRSREEGWIPGVVYKGGESAVSIRVGSRELGRALHTKAGENVLITLEFDEESKKQLQGRPGWAGGENVVLIKELQHHPVSHDLLHVDFHRISLTQKITVSVPLAFKGESVGVKQAGGVLEHLRWEVEVECLPTEIPAEIPVEISGLEKGQTLHVKEIALPEGVKAVTDPAQPVIACVEPKAEEVPVAGEEAATAEEPEVIKQKKPEEETGAETPEGKEKPKEKAEKAKA